jgi:hypothetical protein
MLALEMNILGEKRRDLEFERIETDSDGVQKVCLWVAHKLIKKSWSFRRRPSHPLWLGVPWVFLISVECKFTSVWK